MTQSLRIALFEPDIPQNTGAVLRTAACLDLPVEIIEPCGFVLSDKNLRRVGMDYLQGVSMTRHVNWAAFADAYPDQRRVLLTTRARTAFTDFESEADDILLLGRESAGVPDFVHAACPDQVRVPLASGMRSLNLATAAAMVTSEALRQLGAFPEGAP